MLRRFLILAALAFGGMTISTEASATTLAPLSTEQLTDASEVVIRGLVQDTWTERDANGRIWTRAQIDVVHTYKGKAPRALVVSTLGGAWAGEVANVEGMARFSVGEETILFLERRDNGEWMPVGGFQGKYTVRVDALTGDEAALRYTLPSAKPYDHRFIPTTIQGTPVATLEDQVEARVAAGWDGQPIPGASLDHLRVANGVK